MLLHVYTNITDTRLMLSIVYFIITIMVEIPTCSVFVFIFKACYSALKLNLNGEFNVDGKYTRTNLADAPG